MHQTEITLSENMESAQPHSDPNLGAEIETAAVSHSGELIPAKRQEFILKMVQDHGFVSFATLVSQLGVSHMTIRRDVRKLESSGMLVQVSGGVQVPKRLHLEPSHQTKTTLNSAEKQRIAAAAVKMIPEYACIYLDAGTTSLAMCQLLTNRSDLTIVSNDLEVLNTLSRAPAPNNLIMTGGVIRTQNLSAVGNLAAQTISKLALDIAFLSASSFDLRGITTPDPDKVPVKEAAAASAHRRVLICDSSKYAQFATYIAVPLKNLDTIITDTKLSEYGVSVIKETGVELILV